MLGGVESTGRLREKQEGGGAVVESPGAGADGQRGAGARAGKRAGIPMRDRASPGRAGRAVDAGRKISTGSSPACLVQDRRGAGVGGAGADGSQNLNTDHRGRAVRTQNPAGFLFGDRPRERAVLSER